ncbi:2-hydroxymuconate tautomerase family protein [bacterium LRH843]|nr:2-hydroxymuconate tautomerase family protein [bacterium LRH843]
MPIVTVKLLEGRTDDQKRALIEKVTDAVIETAVCDRDRVSVVIEEMKLTDFGKGGVRPCDE